MYLGTKAAVCIASFLTAVVLFVGAMSKHQQHTLGLYQRRQV